MKRFNAVRIIIAMVIIDVVDILKCIR